MRARQFLLSSALTFLWVTLSAAASNWNQETRDYIVQIHNDRRRAEGGCHISKIEYDQELERQARQWAEGCNFEHEMKEGRGENLAWNTATVSEKDLIKTASDNWFNEKFRYSYGQNSCGSSAACHYTQMVWGSTNKVGCYSTRCSYLSRATSNAWYFVCFYTPKGNWIGEKPYEKGCASPCQEGQTEDKGLCVGEAKNGGGKGAGSEACEDKSGNCPIWVKNGQCEANAGYMKTNCAKSCNFCVSSGGDCQDSHASCALWSKSGECGRNPSFMNKSCKKSCGVC